MMILSVVEEESDVKRKTGKLMSRREGKKEIGAHVKGEVEERKGGKDRGRESYQW